MKTYYDRIKDMEYELNELYSDMSTEIESLRDEIEQYRDQNYDLKSKLAEID